MVGCNSMEGFEMRIEIKKLEQEIEHLTKRVHAIKCLDLKRIICAEIRELVSIKRKMERN